MKLPKWKYPSLCLAFVLLSFTGCQEEASKSPVQVDGDLEWTCLGYTLREFFLVTADPQNPERIWAYSNRDIEDGSAGPLLIRTESGGASWDTLALPGGALRSLIVAPDDGDHLYAGSINAGIYDLVKESRDGGESWSVVNIEEIVIVEDGAVGLFVPASHPDHLYLALVSAGQGRTYVRRGEQASWEMICWGIMSEFAVSPADPELMAMGSLTERRLEVTEDGGDTWSFLTFPDSLGWGVWQLEFPPNQPGVVLVSNNQGIFTTTLTGGEWSRMEFPGVDEWYYEPKYTISDGVELFTLFAGWDTRYGNVRWVYRFDGEVWLPIGEAPFSTSFDLNALGSGRLLMYDVGLYSLTLP